MKQLLEFLKLSRKEFLFLISLAIILSGINNYFFYSHVERHGKKMGKRLENIIKGEIEFCRKNKISGIRYRKNIETIVKNFSSERFYNASLILQHETKGLLLKKQKETDFDGVVASYIKINIPKLKSKHKLNFETTVVFDKSLWLASIVRSITYSIFPSPTNWWHNIDKQWDKVFWYRSRPALLFLFIAYIISLIFKYFETKNKKQITKIKQELEKEKKNKKILETTFGVKEQNEDIELYEAIMSKDITKLQNIKSINPTMNILKFNALIEHTEEEKLEKLEILIKKGIDLEFTDDEGMTVLIYYALGNKDNDTNSKIIETLIKNGIDIDAQNNSGMTALMLCAMKNRPASVKILIDNGANISIKQNLTAKELSATPEIREIIQKAELSHNPKRLVEILNLFTEENPIKYTAHSFEWSRYGSYENFIKEVEKSFKKIEDDLQKLSPNLYDKIHRFLLNKNLDKNNTWGKYHISFGWSSSELKEWSQKEESKPNGKTAFDFNLPERYIKTIDTFYSDGKITIDNFEKVCNVFKNEIEIRDDDKLNLLFQNIEEEVLGFDFEVEYKNLDNIAFYTDVENFKNGLKLIFKQFKVNGREKYDHIIVEAISKENYVDIKITQVNSKAKMNVKDMREEIQSGDFKSIKDKHNLSSLCDWSIEATFNNGDFKIKNLSLDAKEIEIIPLEKAPIGFTYILRFYK